ncbi:chemotaxis protein CheB [Marinobacter sp.]|uniref:chemotaxis protein CheB n=1 Tax=Marinobacter sp. TaxID=50741 RepID=UPI00384B48E8
MSGPSGRPRVGIVSDNVLQRHRLQEAVSRVGLRTGFSGAPERLLGYPELPEVELWLVTLEDEADHPVLFDFLLENTEAPILFGIDTAPKPGGIDYFRWERRLHFKLEQQLGALEEFDSEATLVELADAPIDAPESVTLPQWITPAVAGEPADRVWVLGASLGGPAAVKAFLDHLPAGLPTGFVYAQHIDGNFTDVLTRVLGRHAHYRLVRARAGMRICHGEVVLLPVDHEWTLEPDGTLVEKSTPWPGPYGPSIDQVLLNVSDHYQGRCHAILFSGMGNDGAIAAPVLRGRGSRIWVQNSDSCGNSSMPDSVAETGCTNFTGNPLQLARELVKTIEESCLLARRDYRVPPEDIKHER